MMNIKGSTNIFLQCVIQLGLEKIIMLYYYLIKVIKALTKFHELTH